jgi:5-(carboxyamino)imidazole ribonucleotide mutase
MSRVAIVTGSKSDLPALEPCLQMLDELGIEHEAQVISAHRTPAKLQQFAAGAEEAGFEVVIAAAGMAAHLPGVIAAWTRLPVIGVPIAQAGGSSVSGGLDALLSIAQMPPGVPVGCMAINGAKNAALYAAAILALNHDDVRKALEKFRKEQTAG